MGYPSKGIRAIANWRTRPIFTRACTAAFVAATFSLTLKLVDNEDSLPRDLAGLEIMNDSASWGGFNLVIGLTFVFRTSQAYTHYWEGYSAAHQMYSEWLDATSAVLSFVKVSNADMHVKDCFDHTFVRLVSMLHATASASLRYIDGSQFEMLDPESLDQATLEMVAKTHHPTTMVYQWIMQLLVEACHERVITTPAPIVTRSFQEFSSGMLAYHNAMKIQTMSFPPAYIGMTTMLLVFHFCLTPWVMCNWIRWRSWVFIFTFVQVFVFWALYLTAGEIEHPCGAGKYDSDLIQQHFNEQLVMMLHPAVRKTPHLNSVAAEGLASGDYASMDMLMQQSKPRSSVVRRMFQTNRTGTMSDFLHDSSRSMPSPYEDRSSFSESLWLPNSHHESRDSLQSQATAARLPSYVPRDSFRSQARDSFQGQESLDLRGQNVRFSGQNVRFKCTDDNGISGPCNSEGSQRQPPSACVGDLGESTLVGRSDSGRCKTEVSV